MEHINSRRHLAKSGIHFGMDGFHVRLHLARTFFIRMHIKYSLKILIGRLQFHHDVIQT